MKFHNDYKKLEKNARETTNMIRKARRHSKAPLFNSSMLPPVSVMKIEEVKQLFIMQINDVFSYSMKGGEKECSREAIS